MTLDQSEASRSEIEENILKRFKSVAVSPNGHFQYITGQKALRELRYPDETISALPASVQECFCGVGNPFSAGLPKRGAKVLDVGCGAGVDALVAALSVGIEGHVVGVEFSPDMRAKAEANAALVAGVSVQFGLGSAEKLSFEDSSFDVLISNGVYNLVLRKRPALAEAFRVLRPGGRLQVADQILEGDAPPPMNSLGPSAWAT